MGFVDRLSMLRGRFPWGPLPSQRVTVSNRKVSGMNREIIWDAEDQCSNCGNLWGRIAPIDDEPSSLLYCDDCREEFLAETDGQ